MNGKIDFYKTFKLNLTEKETNTVVAMMGVADRAKTQKLADEFGIEILGYCDTDDFWNNLKMFAEIHSFKERFRLEDIFHKLKDLGYSDEYINIALIPTLEESAKYHHMTIEEQVDDYVNFINSIRHYPHDETGWQPD